LSRQRADRRRQSISQRARLSNAVPLRRQRSIAIPVPLRPQPCVIGPPETSSNVGIDVRAIGQ
jgi:hypothetical protein